MDTPNTNNNSPTTTTTTTTTTITVEPPSTATSSHPRHTTCAACKHQRRRCEANCPLRPYFPWNMQREFRNANRLFGVNRINRMLNQAPENQKDDAAKSIIYEGNARAAFPDTGCVGIIDQLQKRILCSLSELRNVTGLIAVYRLRVTRQSQDGASSSSHHDQSLVPLASWIMDGGGSSSNSHDVYNYPLSIQEYRESGALEQILMMRSRVYSGNDAERAGDGNNNDNKDQELINPVLNEVERAGDGNNDDAGKDKEPPAGLLFLKM